jgi:signal transduction histidine kinase
MLYENQRQNLILYFVVKRQRKLLAENKQLSEETTTELRHMIANVAHDLKTPLSAFMNGVETISTQIDAILDDRKDDFSAGLRGSGEFSIKRKGEKLSSDLNAIQEHLKNLFNTNRSVCLLN